MHRHFLILDSTSEAAKSWACDASTPAPHGAVISADTQTQGRGRLGREWISPAGKGVYLSVIWRPQNVLVSLSQLTIIVALAAARAIEITSGLKAETKWPNDVLVNGKKIGGVLCEAGFEGGRINYFIAGIGLNINVAASELPDRLIFPATSLLLETGKEFDVAVARSVLIEQLQAGYSRYLNDGWNTQRGEFIARCVVLGQRIKVRSENNEFEGVAVGIDNDGLLVAQCADGLQTVVAGDVSLS